MCCIPRVKTVTKVDNYNVTSFKSVDGKINTCLPHDSANHSVEHQWTDVFSNRPNLVHFHYFQALFRDKYNKFCLITS